MFTDEIQGVPPAPTDDVVEPEEGKPDPLDTITDIEELRKAAKANRGIASRYKKKSADGPKPPTPTLPNPPKPPEADISDRLSAIELSEKKRSVGHELSLSPEETDNLFKFAGSSDPREAFKSPFFQAGLKEVRRAARVSENTPPSSNRATKVEGKTFAEMTEDERKKNWGKIAGKK